MTGLTSKISEFAANLDISDIPQDCLLAPISGLTDCVGVMIAGAKEEAPRIVSELVRPADLSTSSPVVPSGELYDAPDAALINGTAAHVLDYDDVGIDGHPSTVLGPAIFAEGWALKSSGADALKAYVIGYEIWALLNKLEPGMMHDRGFHPTAVYGTLACAAACASLYGLDEERTRNAIAIAGSLASGLVANFGTMTKSLHAGRTAQSGILAARLAKRGYTGSEDALEHSAGFLKAHSPSGSVVTDVSKMDLGQIWRIRDLGVNIKRYPICYGTHRAIDAMLDLVEKHDLKPDQVRFIRTGVGTTQLVMLRNHKPQTGLEAKFSMEFAMTSALIAHNVGLAQLTDDFVLRDDVQSNMKKVSTEAIHDGIPGLIPTEGPMHADTVEVELVDGTIIKHEPVEYPKGSWQKPLDRDGLFEKFIDCAKVGMDEKNATELFDQLYALQDLPSLRSLKFGG